MGRTARKKQQPSQANDGPEVPIDSYRWALLCSARSMVADMFFQPRSCPWRGCRNAGHCVACDHLGFCPEPMTSEQHFILLALITFHDRFFSEYHGYQPPDPNGEWIERYMADRAAATEG